MLCVRLNNDSAAAGHSRKFQKNVVEVVHVVEGVLHEDVAETSVFERHSVTIAERKINE